MQVQKIQSTNQTCFGIGKISLNRINSKDLLKYDEIKRIAETNKLDFDITKSKKTKYLPTSDCYIVFAKQEIEQFPFFVHGTGCAIVNKKAPVEEVSDKLYNAAIDSVKRLAENIKKHTGTKPDFLAMR